MSSSDDSSSSSSSSADSDDRRLALRRKLTHEAGSAQALILRHDDKMNDDAAAASSSAPKLNPLDTLAAAPSAPILPLPARALDRILDALPLSDLLQLSIVARSWYSSCMHYSQTLGSAAVGRPIIDVKTRPKLQLLRESHLRGLVTALNCAQFTTDVLDPTSFVSAVSAPSASAPFSLPSLQTLHIHLSSLRSDVTVALPPSLTDLHLALSFHTSSTKRGVPLEEGKPPPSWSGEECDDFVDRILRVVAQLPKLRCFFLSNPQAISSSSNASPAPYWLAPLRAAPALETLGFDFESFRPIAELRAMPHLRQFVVPSQRENTWKDAMPKLLAPPHKLRLTQLPLRTAEISKETVSFLLTLSHSLESLAPRHWDLTDLSWLAQMSKLNRLSFREYTYSSGVNPSVASIVALLPRMPQLTSLTIAYPSFDSEHLEAVLDSLPLLASLEVESKAMRSLAPFAWHPALARSLTDLKLCCPRLPRDEISHLLCLLELKRLDIAGSFSEPLFARQLAPFEPPYPKQLHWLRTFVPRSAKEPVPTPPVDPAAIAAAHAAFDARVRAGEVAAAELLNAGQLSGVFRFLCSRDFSLAARSCRAWRTAASLPSAWGFPTPASSSPHSHEAAPVSPAWTLSLFSLLGQGVALLPPHADRFLRFTDQSPELSTDILPHLQLWRHARGLELQLNSQPAFSVYWSANLVAQQRIAHEAPLRALQCLSRLETLVTDWTPYVHTGGIVSAMAAVGPRLKRVDMANLPRECWEHLPNLQALYYHWTISPIENTPSRAPDISALSRMHSLHTLVLRCSGGECSGLGAALRTLSVHHCLRHASLELKTLDKSTIDLAPWPLETVLSELTGISCMSTAPSEAAETDEAERKEGVEHTLAEMVASASSSRSSAAAAAPDTSASSIFPPAGPPSLLESFSLLVDENTKMQGSTTAAFPFAAVVLGLPRLKRLQLTVLVPQAAADLGALERVASFFPDRVLELESLCLGIEVAWSSFEALRVFTRLTALRLMDSRACRNTEALSIHTSNMKLNPGALPSIVRGMPRLSLLVLDGVEVPSGDLGCIASLTALKSLRLFRQDALQLADLDVLAHCPQLEELTLARLDRVPLQARTWMAAHGRQLSAEEADEAKMLAAYEDWRGAGTKKIKHSSTEFGGDSEAEGEEEKQQGETKEEAEAAENIAPPAPPFDDPMDDAPPAAAAPAAAPAAAAAAAAAEDDLPLVAPGALVKQVSKLLVHALNTHLAARSKSAELFAATVAAHPQRPSQFTDLLHLLRTCCRCNKLRRFDWSPSSSMLETNVAYTWAHSYAPLSDSSEGADMFHEARLAMERARDRVALRTLVQARMDEIELATAATKSSASSSSAASASSSVIPPPLLVEMRLASHLPYTRMRTIAEQSLCPPLTAEERALSHPTAQARNELYQRTYMRGRAAAKSFSPGLQFDDEPDVRNIDDPATDAEKLQQEQESLLRAKAEASAMPAYTLGSAPTSAASAASSSAPTPMSDA